MSKQRIYFTPSQDAIILDMKANDPKVTWVEIASKIEGKTAKQCNDRYHKHLKEKKNSSPWTEEEDEKLLQLVKENGHKWVMISKIFSDRTCVQCKNRWNLISKRSVGQKGSRRSSRRKSGRRKTTPKKAPQKEKEKEEPKIDLSLEEKDYAIFDQFFLVDEEGNDFNSLFMI